MYRLCRKSCLCIVWSVVPQNNGFTKLFMNLVYKYITYIFHMKQTWSVEPRFHGFLETSANQKRLSVCGAMWDKGINLTLGVLLTLYPWVAPQNRVAGMNALGSASFFLANTSDLTLCKFSLESVFYSYINNLNYLAQMLGYWDNVSVCCYFNWANQLLFWHDSKRLKVWNSKNYCLCVNIKTGQKPPTFLSELNQSDTVQ